MAGAVALGAELDIFDAVHRDLLQRAWRSIDERVPQPASAARARAAGRMEVGLADLRRLLLGAGLSEELIDETRRATDRDPRLSFIYNLPASAAFGGALGNALEDGLYGDKTTETRELTTLLNVFVTMLDGLIDEAPELLHQDQELLGALSKPGNLVAYTTRDAGPTGMGESPLIVLLRSVLVAWIARSAAGAGWRSNASVRRRYLSAVDDALASEFRSEREQSIQAPLVNAHATRRVLFAKATAAIWVSALAPICLRGWPADVDWRAYRAAMHSCGAFFGWLDDLRDVRRDLAARRWNTVLLGLWERLGSPPVDSATIEMTILSALAFDDNARSCVDVGKRLLDDALAHMRDARLERSELVPLLSDASRAWLFE